MTDHAEILNKAADDLIRFAAHSYPVDALPSPTGADYAEINALLQRTRGHKLDRVAADCYRSAISLAASMLRQWAEEHDDA